MILQQPNHMLRQVLKKTSRFGTDYLEGVVKMLFAEMEKYNGAGLAANQLGINERVFVYGIKVKNPRYPNAPLIPYRYMINPEIIWQSEETLEIEEGCLSVPGTRILIKRPAAIKVKYNDLGGNELFLNAVGFEGRIIQHENDHLNGILLVDYMQNSRLPSAKPS